MQRCADCWALCSRTCRRRIAAQKLHGDGSPIMGPLRRQRQHCYALTHCTCFSVIICLKRRPRGTDRYGDNAYQRLHAATAMCMQRERMIQTSQGKVSKHAHTSLHTGLQKSLCGTAGTRLQMFGACAIRSSKTVRWSHRFMMVPKIKIYTKMTSAR